MQWTIDRTDGPPLSLTLSPGANYFIVGSNGSGKSALIQSFVSNNRNAQIRRIVAHRPTAFRSDRPRFAFQDRAQAEQQIQNTEMRLESRWKEEPNIGHEIQSIVLSDLIANENDQARFVRDLVRKHDLCAAQEASSEASSPFGKINNLFQAANFSISLSLSKSGDILARRIDTNAEYSIAQMSDGERNAAIIAATVLTVQSGTILLIDEPERHLHRSIILPFLSTLFHQRNDCVFVISTHDIDLPTVDSCAQILMVRSCLWEKNKPISWDINLLDRPEELPESIRRDILGSRKKVLFVEGTEGSLDMMIYSKLFPNIVVTPRGSCGEVIRAVHGLRESSALHDVEAFGVIDRDDRVEAEVVKLSEQGVHALDVCSAESLYYCESAIMAVADWQAQSFASNCGEMARLAKKEALEVLSREEIKGQMAARRVERKIREYCFSVLPKWKEILQEEFGKIALDAVKMESMYAEEIDRYQQLISKEEYDLLITRYPVRYSETLAKVAKAMKCRNIQDYEYMVIARIGGDRGLEEALKARLGALTAALSE